MQRDWDDLVKEYKKPRKRRRTKVIRRHLWVENRDDALVQGGTAMTTAIARRSGRQWPQLGFSS